MDIQSTIILGIISGILTSIIIWIVVKVFSSVLIPWFESLVYKGIDISGDWNATIQLTPSNYQVKLTINIKQNGHKLFGDMVALYIDTTDNNERRTRKLKFTGTITDNNIVVTYKSATKKLSSLGVFFLREHLGGEQLKGTMLSSDRISENILCYEDIIWKRKHI